MTSNGTKTSTPAAQLRYLPYGVPAASSIELAQAAKASTRIYAGIQKSTSDSETRVSPHRLTSFHGLLREGNERAGRLRDKDEVSQFAVYARQPEDEGFELRRFARVNDSPGKRLDRLCSDFRAWTPERPFASWDAAQAARPLAALFIGLLKLRPFPDANDHLAWLALQAGIRRLDQRPILVSHVSSSSAQTLAFNYAVADALQGRDSSFTAIVDFLAAHL